MSYGLNRVSTRTKLIAGALALILAGVSHASGTQVAGGATLPSILYVGTGVANSSLQQFTDGTVVNPPTPNNVGTIAASSLFGAYDAANGATSSYCLTGSGSGKNILAGIANNNVQNPCPVDSTGTLHGFGAKVVGRTDLVQPNFAGADAPLSQTDFTNYTTNGNHGGSLPVQFPVVAGTVAIAFNLKDNTNTQVTSAEANFTDLQVCQIFSGKVTTWDQVASAFTLPAGHSIPANPINVQYRSDGSGTSFSFSNHLAAVCAAAGLSGGPFEASQNFFNTATPPYVVQNFLTSKPANWTGSSGNPAVARAIGATANSVGYVETTNALNTLDASGNPLVLQFGNINGTNPVTNFNVSTLTTLSIATNQVINGNNTDGTPALSLISPAPSTKCIVIVRPNQYAKPSSLSGSIVPVGSYPIVAVSYFLGNSTGNNTDLATTQGLVTSPYNPPSGFTAPDGLKVINPGLAFPGSSSTVSASTVVKGCYVN